MKYMCVCVVSIYAFKYNIFNMNRNENFLVNFLCNSYWAHQAYA